MVVIPAKNEEATIGLVVKKIKADLGSEIVVVNDGSTDNTVDEAISAGAKVLSPVLPLGAWGATQTGIHYALKKGCAAVVTMDADGQHESAFVSEMHALIASGQADVVIGSCPQRGSVSRRLAWAMFRKLTGLGFGDLTSGFRIYNRAAMEVLASAEATLLDYQDIGVLIMLRKAGLEIKEYPVAMSQRQTGKSRIFNSWFAVSWYLLQTGILCLARWESKVPTAPRP
ncbi:MAG: glycosyltransferase family 2 protein [Sulfuricellaceae bacterium]|nr:glycosyltransferase family 2 protein [Sulfuricellaceae bacterium]